MLRNISTYFIELSTVDKWRDYEYCRPTSLEFEARRKLKDGLSIDKSSLSKKSPFVYTVPSSTTDKLYKVDLDNWQCTCPSYIYDGRPCKHIYAVCAYIAESGEIDYHESAYHLLYVIDLKLHHPQLFLKMENFLKENKYKALPQTTSKAGRKRVAPMIGPTNFEKKKQVSKQVVKRINVVNLDDSALWIVDEVESLFIENGKPFAEVKWEGKDPTIEEVSEDLRGDIKIFAATIVDYHGEHKSKEAGFLDFAVSRISLNSQQPLCFREDEEQGTYACLVSPKCIQEFFDKFGLKSVIN